MTLTAETLALTQALPQGVKDFPIGRSSFHRQHPQIVSLRSTSPRSSGISQGTPIRTETSSDTGLQTPRDQPEEVSMPSSPPLLDYPQWLSVHGPDFQVAFDVLRVS